MSEKVPERFRLFVAIPVPPEVKARILDAQSQLKRYVADGVRWTTPDQFHLTLRFLGSVEADGIENLSAALESACASFKPLQLRAAQIGFFPRPHSPRVVWVGVIDSGNQIADLHQAIQTASHPFTTEPPETQFTGHITLGRVKDLDRRGREALANAGTALARVDCGSWVAQEVQLVRSQLSPHGARYSTVSSALLRSGT